VSGFVLMFGVVYVCGCGLMCGLFVERRSDFEGDLGDVMEARL